MILLRLSILTIVSGNLLWRYAAGCSVVRIFHCLFLSVYCVRWPGVNCGVCCGDLKGAGGEKDK
jgi:hypothetical protein